jgi:tellurite resistance protein
MFLDNLTFVEQEAFIKLAHIVASTHGIVEEQERKLLESYTAELGIDYIFHDLHDVTIDSIESIANTLQNEKTKRKVFVEIVAIAFADGVYEESEKKVIFKIRKAFHFTDQYYEQVKKWVQDYNKIYLSGLKLIDME